MLQTLPQLVYLIPFVYLFPISYVPGIIAAVLYAAPVVIRLVSAGIRDVPANTVEAAESFGATRRQVLLKVKIPLARDAIMLGVNQGIIMVLAVVVIGGLVGRAASATRSRTDCSGASSGRASWRRSPSSRSASRWTASPGGTGGRGWREIVDRTNGGGLYVEGPERGGAGCSWPRSRSPRPLAFAGVSSATAGGKSCGTVTLNEQAWSGSTANTYVAKYVLEQTSAAR